MIKEIVCRRCGTSFTYERSGPGRPPLDCPECRKTRKYSYPGRERKPRVPKSAICHPDKPRHTKDKLCYSCYWTKRYRTEPAFREQEKARMNARYVENAEYRAYVMDYNRNYQRRLADDKHGPLLPRPCAECGEEYTPQTRHATNRYCSRSCQNRVWDRVKRARNRGLETEEYGRVEIFERDGWVCGICGGKINPKREHPHPKSASIDHIIPQSLGGPDTRVNVQAAHLRCNLSKGNRAANDQLLLVG